MRYKQLVKLLQKHPYLLEPCVTMSLVDAKKEIAAFELPTFEQIIAGAKRRSNLPAEAWNPAERAIENQKNLVESGLKTPVSHLRRWVIVAVAVAVLAFFALTPIGRAWATEAWNFIATIFDDRIEIEHSGDSGEILATTLPPRPFEALERDSKMESNTVYYEDLSVFVEATGKNPVTLESYGIQLEDIYSVEDVAELVLFTTYRSDSDAEVHLMQTWADTSQTIDAAESFSGWTDYRISDIYTVYYGIDNVTGTFNGVIVLPDSIITLAGDASLDIEWLAKALCLP
ncbi:MAG: hypothetical protein Q4C04_04060 [Clostridia bacterium]|nr:hypothetical protein [Clostridia bacterium]